MYLDVSVNQSVVNRIKQQNNREIQIYRDRLRNERKNRREQDKRLGLVKRKIEKYLNSLNVFSLVNSKQNPIDLDASTDNIQVSSSSVEASTETSKQSDEALAILKQLKNDLKDIRDDFPDSDDSLAKNQPSQPSNSFMSFKLFKNFNIRNSTLFHFLNDPSRIVFDDTASPKLVFVSILNFREEKSVVLSKSASSAFRVTCIAIHRYEPVLVCGSNDGFVRAVDYNSYKLIAEFDCSQSIPTCVTFHSNQSFVLIGTDNGCLIILDKRNLNKAIKIIQINDLIAKLNLFKEDIGEQSIHCIKHIACASFSGILLCMGQYGCFFLDEQKDYALHKLVIEDSNFCFGVDYHKGAQIISVSFTTANHRPQQSHYFLHYNSSPLDVTRVEKIAEETVNPSHSILEEVFGVRSTRRRMISPLLFDVEPPQPKNAVISLDDDEEEEKAIHDLAKQSKSNEVIFASSNNTKITFYAVKSQNTFQGLPNTLHSIVCHHHHPSKFGHYFACMTTESFEIFRYE